MHMTGDLHEPCHAASLFSNRFNAIDGDHVATRLPVSINGKTRSMHSLWDAQLGGNVDLALLKATVRVLADDPSLQRSALPELQRDTTVASWVQESFDIAVVSVYDADVRAAITAQEADPKAPFKPIPLSDEYLNRAQQIGHRQGALAGLRLADTLARVPW